MLSSFPNQKVVAETLRRSLQSGRLAHASLFVGPDLNEMEAMATALAQTLHCENPPSRSGESGLNTDACGVCRSCTLIAQRKDSNVRWIYPESKIRIITTDQIRQLISSFQLKSLSGGYEIAVLCGADRLNVQAANAFLKTLEEPFPGKLFILLTHDAQKILPTILSRCRHFIFEGINRTLIDSDIRDWLNVFVQTAASSTGGIISRYSLLAPMVSKLADMQTAIETELKNNSPLSLYPDAEEKQKERWEKELQAAIASEYRRQRSAMIGAVELWLRDVWLTLVTGSFPETAHFPDLHAATETVAGRITEKQARENLKNVGQIIKSLETNIQEALILEVFLLKLSL